MPEYDGPLPYEVWPAGDDETLAFLRVVQARHALDAAQQYVERYHDLLGYPAEVRVRVRRTTGLAPSIRTFDVRVEVLPVAVAVRVGEGVELG